MLSTSQSNLFTQQIDTKGHFPAEYPLENDCKVFAPTLAQSIPHRKPIFASGAAGRRRGAFHMNLPVCTLIGNGCCACPASRLLVCGKKKRLLPAKIQVQKAALQPTYDKHPKNEGNTPWSVIGP